MGDPFRPTAQTVEMIDAHIQAPRIGQVIWGLGKGGCVHLLTWNSDSINHYDAWYPSPKIPQSVKERKYPKMTTAIDNERPMYQHLPNIPQVPNKVSNVDLYPKYFKDVTTLEHVDIYEVHKLFNIQDPSGAIQHASKKLLLSGSRTGNKSAYQDIKEARDTLNRWLEMNPQD